MDIQKFRLSLQNEVREKRKIMNEKREKKKAKFFKIKELLNKEKQTGFQPSAPGHIDINKMLYQSGQRNSLDLPIDTNSIEQISYDNNISLGEDEPSIEHGDNILIEKSF